MRDIYRLSNEQTDSIAITKYAGYWAFWVRKLKPIRWAFDRDHAEYGSQQENSELSNINELIALEIAITLLPSERVENVGPPLADPNRSHCQKSCNGVDCFNLYAKDFFSVHDRYNENYIIYSMRHRTFGPHHMTMLLDSIVFGSCSAYSG